MEHSARMLTSVIVSLAFFCLPASANSLILGNDSHSITGFATASINTGQFVATIAAGPTGATLDERHSAGLGVDSRAVAGSTADTSPFGGATKMNVIGGSGPLAGSGEFVTLSFDRPGVLRHLLFDGVKDESLEFFQLSLPNGQAMTIFDSQTQDKLEDQGFGLADLQVTNPILCQTEEDDLYALNYSFAAGEVFTITYGEVDFHTLLPGYVPVVDQIPNGARLEGFTVIPEPACISLFFIGFVSQLLSGRSSKS